MKIRLIEQVEYIIEVETKSIAKATKEAMRRFSDDSLISECSELKIVEVINEK